MAVSHVAVDLRLGNQCCHGVHYNNIHSPGANHGLCDFQSLLAVIRLRNVQIINIHAYVLCIDRVKRMLRVNKSGNSAPFLDFRDHMKRNCRLTTGFRTINLHDSSLGDASQSERNIQTQRACWDRLDIHLCRRITELHDRALPVLLLNLAYRRIQCFQLFIFFHLGSPFIRNKRSVIDLRIKHLFAFVNHNFRITVFMSIKTPSMAITSVSFLFLLKLVAKRRNTSCRMHVV